MGLLTFKGGIHPNDMKHLTCEKQIKELEAPDVLTFPLSQHIGAPAVPCVKVGDTVNMGQKIAEAPTAFSANIHSSVSGKVVAIEPCMHPNGTEVNSIVIENNRQDTIDEAVTPHEDYKKLKPKEIVDIIKEAGIVGMGGATFPTHIKLSPPPEKKIDYVIINGAECEPYLTSDHRAMLENPEDIILGLKIIMHIFNLKEGYIAIESNKPDAIAKMTEYAGKETDVQIHVKALKTKYPQATEKQLISAIAKRQVPPGKLPLDVGAVVNNIDTCASIARAVTTGMPLIKRIVTVSGDCVKEPTNFSVRIGTPFSYLFENAGGFSSDPMKIIMGGPMMGTAVASINVPVIKGTSGLLAFSEKMVGTPRNETCLRCGKCVSACPMRLMPNALNAACKAEDFEKLEKLHIMDCMECGSCSYLCPAKQHPVQSIRIAKQKMRNMKK